jgi:hypothetical protein
MNNMKYVLSILFSAATLVLGCRSSGSKDATPFLPGMYVSQSENEFCRVVDTFIIRRNTLGGDGYQITRKSSFQRIRKGVLLPAEYQSDQWPAIYEMQRKALKPMDKGKELLYDSGENTIYNNGTGYEKVE